MAGGLLQIAHYGSQDLYLTGNPEISFFKSVYRKYTNFSMESIRLEFGDGSFDLSENSDSQLSCKIERNGDLLHDLYFCFELPNIYSGKYSVTGAEPYYNYEFQWIKNIGTNIIDYVDIFIGSNIIDKHYGEWMNIWSELNMDTHEKEKFDDMIGNVSEMYDPKFGEGQNGLYPNITSGSYSNQSEKYNQDIITISNATSGKTVPSIRKMLIKVPLLFWFNKNIGLSLPLISLQHTDIILKFKLKSVNNLFTIIETNKNVSYHRKRVKGGVGGSHNSLANFVLDPDMVIEGNPRQLNYLRINPYIEANYIYLDNEERVRFASEEGIYLIEQIKRKEITGVNSTKNHRLYFNRPIKYLSWIGRRSDAIERNDWNNYTNWIYPDVPPYSKEYAYKDKFILSTDTSKSPFYTYGDTTQQSYFRIDNMQKNILKNAALLFDGLLRVRSKDDNYYNKIQLYKYFKTNKINNGIHSYSFSIEPTKYQPGGACNFSYINNVQIQLDVNSIPLDSNSNNYYTYDFHIYSVSYNILRIMSGMGNIEYSN